MGTKCVIERIRILYNVAECNKQSIYQIGRVGLIWLNWQVD
jgi:hypothetical protein